MMKRSVWRDDGTLITNEATPPEGWIEYKPGIYKPNCGGCVFRRFSTKSGSNPLAVIHCRKFEKTVTVEDCQQCSEISLDKRRIKECRPWVPDYPWGTPEAENARRRDLDEVVKAKAEASRKQWLPCIYRVKIKTECGSCRSRGCTNTAAPMHGQQVYKIDCSKCEVRDEGSNAS